MTPDYPYHLNEIGLTLRKRRRFLGYMTLAAVVAGVLLHFVVPQRYKVETRFLLRNPLFNDRNNIYSDDRHIGYFAAEEEVERLISMAGSDSVKSRIIRDLRLDQAYDFRLSDPEAAYRLQQSFTSRLRLYRAEDNSIVLNYADRDRDRAARVANHTVQVLDKAYRSFYNGMWNGKYQSLQARIGEQDSAIQSLTDTLVALRERYGIYDIISPSRHNLMVGTVSRNGTPGYARGLELVQNIESVKDELVSSRATNITLLGQYTTGMNLRQQPLVQVLSAATPHIRPAGVGFIGMILISGFAGLLFGVLYSVAAAWLFGEQKQG